MQHTGASRSAVQADHALITPESHVPLALPGWRNGTAIGLISREMGAKFAQYLLQLQPDGVAAPPNGRCEHFVLALEGEATLSYGDERHALAAGAFAYLPPAALWRLRAPAGCQALLFEKRYAAIPNQTPPLALHGCLDDVPALPFLGDEAAMLQQLLPDDPRFDWAINAFEFAPGGTLPQVESHFMEHGLYMLAGQGVYRLGERWYPVQAGDSIWMAPYLPQWFAATGKSPAGYIYYKEMHRAPDA